MVIKRAILTHLFSLFQKTFLVLMIFFLVSLNLYSQKLTGVWEGDLYQGLRRFQFKMTIQHFQNSIQGYSYIYDIEGYWGKISFSGSIRNDSIFYSEEKIKDQNEGPNSWCIKSGIFKSYKDSSGEVIKGIWDGNCAPGTLMVRKTSSYDSLQNGSTGELVMEGGRIKSIPKRNLKIGKSVKIKKSVLKIEVFDSREVDGDSVTIIFDNTVILKNYALKKTPKEITLRLDTNLTKHTLVLYAENLGKIPPNTATIKVKSGYGSKLITLQSDLDNSDNIIFYFPERKRILAP